MTTTTLACPKCGSAYSPGTRFCSSCGTDVSGGAGARAAVSEGATAVIERDEILPILMEATLGDYDIYGLLGKGGMATVYLALDLALNRKVAIKVMNPQMLMGDDAIARFKREAQTAANLQHPNVIPIYAVKQTPKLVFFVMKYIEGRPLDSIVKEVRQLPVEMATGILTQVSSALNYAHKRGIVHRDIKPANIMIDEDGQAIVTDFGIAKVQEAKGLTMTGATVGTPAYMSPEQYEGKNIAGAADQYSLGVVAYEMLTGHPPFGGDSIMTIMKGHLMEAPPPIDAERSGLPPQVAATVMRMLEKRIEDRFADMAAVIAAFDAKVLHESHPARTQLMELAKTGAMMRPRMSVPLSPVPAGKATPRLSQAVQPETTEEHPAPKGKSAKPKPAAPAPKSNTGLMVGVAAVVLAAAGGGWFMMSKNAAPAPAATETVTQAPPPQAPPVQTTPPVDSAALAAANAPPVAPPPAAEPPKDSKADKKAADAAKKAAADREKKLAADAAKKAPTADDELARLRGAGGKPVGGQSEVDRLRQAAGGAAPVAAAPVAAAPAPAPRSAEPARTESPKADAASAGGTGNLKIASNVPDAVLEIDGVSKGPMGEAVRTVPVKAGSVRWVVKKAGCEPASGTADVTAGGTVTIGRNKASPLCQ